MFAIGNAAENYRRSFSSSATSIDAGIIAKLEREYAYVRDPLLHVDDDIEFHDFIRAKALGIDSNERSPLSTTNPIVQPKSSFWKFFRRGKKCVEKAS
ncbi:hypothetical protein JX265_000954 [Neoarthrinium moseri]|uniref:Uncharacterized protein n=1 Tax=Neoarthrinium moseri TaxID=1658444 RepID=A0A9P9WXA1_9PEZI|nr:hypothetical protein JX265_000954 [Neoarthrinium moseri]